MPRVRETGSPRDPSTPSPPTASPFDPIGKASLALSQKTRRAVKETAQLETIHIATRADAFFDRLRRGGLKDEVAVRAACAPATRLLDFFTGNGRAFTRPAREDALDPVGVVGVAGGAASAILIAATVLTPGVNALLVAIARTEIGNPAVESILFAPFTISIEAGGAVSVAAKASLSGAAFGLGALRSLPSAIRQARRFQPDSTDYRPGEACRNINAGGGSTSQIPAARFFRSADDYGFDMKALSRTLVKTKSWTNPETNQDFSPADQGRILRHPSGEGIKVRRALAPEGRIPTVEQLFDLKALGVSFR